MRTHAIVRTHTRPMRERGAAGAIFSDRGRALVLISAFLLIYREPASASGAAYIYVYEKVP